MVIDMVNIPDDALKMFQNSCDKEKPLIWVSTVTPDGEPHLAPVCYVVPTDKDKLLIAISFATKTAANIEEGSGVALGVAVYPSGYMVKGSGEIIRSGKHFDTIMDGVTKRYGGKIKPVAALLVSAEKVYALKPAAGKKRIA
ncbi:MAG TPA: hypothetical protein HA257_03370 [Candidatus Methanoperedenaceae archaeon]|nr:hypothetical protein [Candidatus Methanoperedenaceae archaeon]